MNRKLIHVTAFALLAAMATLAWPCSFARAEVRLPAIFADHMVLQRDVPITVWGWADPGEAVAVALGRYSADGEMVLVGPGTHLRKTKADTDGRWAVQLDAAESGGPCQLRVEGPRNSVSVQDVFVGDVWFASGQSNMYWPVKNSADAEKEIASADWPQIRSFDVWKDAAAEPRDDVYGKWVVCSPKTAGNFSAVAYYFARHLHRELNKVVPIGIVHASWAASSAHPWTSREGLAADPEVKRFAESVMKNTEKNLTAFRDEFEPKWAEWRKAVAEAKAAEREPPRRPEVSFRNNVRHVPSALWNGMVAPLVRYPVKGVIWYQGENDAHRGMFYHAVFKALIEDWRRQWHEPDMPFLFVQLAAFQARKDEPSDSQWARLREAQAATLCVPHTAMACAIDIGEAENIHPKNKQDVGLRLALGALKVAYGRDVVCSGPTFTGVTVDGNRATLSFDHVGGGLAARGGQLKGFSVAGDDRKFVWAKAVIEGDKVVVTSDAVPKIVAVRYAWADNPECNLYNAEGLPAVPFRTDDWPLAQ